MTQTGARRKIRAGTGSFGFVVLAGFAAVSVTIGSMLVIGGNGVSAEGRADCSTVVVDETGTLDEAAVLASVAKIDEANVLVRGYDSVPDGDLTATIDELIAVCLETEGISFGNDIAVISFSIADRASDVFYGPLVSGRSDPTAVRESMSDRFADGDFTGGVVAAVDTLAADLDADDANVAAGSTSDAGDDSGSSGIGSTLLLGGALAVVAVVGGGVFFVRRRRSLSELRAGLERDVAGPRIRVGAGREQGLRVEADAGLWAKVSAGKTLTVLLEKRKAVRDAGKATEGAASLLGTATPDGIARASASQIADARRRLVDLDAALDGNELALGELLAFGAHIDHLRVSLPAKRELLLQELSAAGALASQRRQEGWQVDEAVGELAAVRALIQPLEFYELALDHLALSERIEGAEAKLFAAEHDLQSMPDRPAALVAWRGEQVRASEAQEARSRTVEDRMNRVTAEHGSESWSWARDHPAQARRLLAEGLAIGAGIDEVIDQQAFDEAGRVLERAGLELIGADDLLDEVDDLLVDLEQAKIEAPGILAESRQVLGQFAAFVANHASDLDPDLRAQPDLLGRTLDGLAAELVSDRPSYLRVAETAEHINRQLDGLMIAAHEQHRAVEALRRQSVREVARAQRNLRRARESLGWELLQSNDGRAIERLAMALDRLPDDLQARIAAASTIADDAIRIQDRIIARRRRNGNWLIVGGAHRPGGSSSWGSTWGSGGTAGHGGFGGGGSRTFGGGGGGGSRSFGGGRSSGSW